MHKDCLKCGEIYTGSFVGAMAHDKKNLHEIGYFGGWCKCGARLGESYNWEGIMNNKKKVYASEWLKWQKSLSASKYQEIFGGPKDVTISMFWYDELYLAKNEQRAKKKFLKLLNVMRRHSKGKARLCAADFSPYGRGMYCAMYHFETAGFPEEIKKYLILKRKYLGVEPYP